MEDQSSLQALAWQQDTDTRRPRPRAAGSGQPWEHIFITSGSSCRLTAAPGGRGKPAVACGLSPATSTSPRPLLLSLVPTHGRPQ